LSDKPPKPIWARGELHFSPLHPLRKKPEGVMSKKTHKQYPRLSIRLSDTERLDIESRAQRAGLSMGGYCKFVIFNTDPPRRSRRVVPEKAELSRLIGQVSRVGANINQIAKQLNMYSAIDVVEVSNAMADVAELRASIMKALGYREETEDDH